MLAASPAIYGHVMMQMTTNPSLPIHTPDLPPQAKLLDAKNQILVTQDKRKEGEGIREEKFSPSFPWDIQYPLSIKTLSSNPHEKTTQ